MPYRNYYRRGRRYAKRKGYNAPSYNTAAKALSTALAVKKLLNVEYKHYDQAGTAAPPTAGQVILFDNGMLQGDSTTQREGNSILVKSLQFKGRFISTVNAQQVRVLMVQDTDNQGAAPAVTDILSAADPNAFYNVIDYPGRFRILGDKTVNLSGAVGPSIREINMYHKGGFHIKYNGATGAVTDRRKNAVYILWISTGSSTLPTTQNYRRMRWIDN